MLQVIESILFILFLNSKELKLKFLSIFSQLPLI